MQRCSWNARVLFRYTDRHMVFGDEEKEHDIVTFPGKEHGKEHALVLAVAGAVDEGLYRETLRVVRRELRSPHRRGDSGQRPSSAQGIRRP